MITVTQNLLDAAKDYFDKQARRSHPDGDFDNAKRWYPDDSERCKCCRGIREPSRGWPFSLLKHCRSVEHIATLHDVDVSELRKVCNLLKKNGGEENFKMAADAVTASMMKPSAKKAVPRRQIATI